MAQQQTQKTEFRLDRGTEYFYDKTSKLMYHPDLGWGIYVCYDGHDWEWESAVSERVAAEEVASGHAKPRETK